MKHKLQILVCAVSVLLVVAVIVFVVNDTEPLYGQGRSGFDANNQLPDLIGTWRGDAEICSFSDVTDTSNQPVCQQIMPGEMEDFVITEQAGRVFAGIFDNFDGAPDEDRITGVILSDRTVSIQLFELSELRGFLTGRLTGAGDNLEISGYFHVFDDFGGGGRRGHGNG